MTCIKVSSDGSHFNVSLIVRDKVTRQCPQITTCEEKGEPKRVRTEVPQLTSLTPYRWAKPAQEETVSHRHNNNVKEVGTLPVRSNLCTPELALSTAARNWVTLTECEWPPVERRSKKDSPTHYESPTPPPSSDLSGLLQDTLTAVCEYNYVLGS